MEASKAAYSARSRESFCLIRNWIIIYISSKCEWKIISPSCRKHARSINKSPGTRCEWCYYPESFVRIYYANSSDRNEKHRRLHLLHSDATRINITFAFHPLKIIVNPTHLLLPQLDSQFQPIEMHAFAVLEGRTCWVVIQQHLELVRRSCVV